MFFPGSNITRFIVLCPFVTYILTVLHNDVNGDISFYMNKNVVAACLRKISDRSVWWLMYLRILPHIMEGAALELQIAETRNLIFFFTVA
jgi:hypothetical protein